MIRVRISASSIMKSYLLFIFSLTAGCEASSEVNVCPEGWVEFTVQYPNTNGKYQNIDVVFPNKTLTQSTQKDVWETKDRVSLYHDTKNKNLRVYIKHLRRADFGDYKCRFYSRPDSIKKVKVELEKEKVGCQKLFIQTAYRTAKTSITCDYPKKHRSNVQFFCKENGFFCEDILATKSSLKSNGTFTLKHTNSGFNMSISNVSSQHAGIYWCGEESMKGCYRAALTQIHLKVQVPPTRSTPSVLSSTSHDPVATASVPSAQSTPASAERHDSVIIAVVVTVAVLVLVFILFLLYKRIKPSKNTRNGEAQNNKEDRTYEEIQEHPQKSDSGTASKTIYVTANSPTNLSAFNKNITVNCQNSSGKVNEHTYSTITDNPQCPNYSTVNLPSRFSEVPSYFTVSYQQQHAEKP